MPPPSTPAHANVSRLPVMSATKTNKRTSTSPPRTTVTTGGHFTAAPSAKRSPIGTRSRLTSLIPGPSSPLATPPGRPSSAASGGRLLNAYGTTSVSTTTTGNKRKPTTDRIKVCVRKRPTLHGDGPDCVAASAAHQRVTIAQEKAGLDGISRIPDQHTFHFDHVFDENMSNEHLFRVCVEPLLECFWGGGKATCFAYGQTGSGKTFTMLHPTHGLFFMALQRIFDEAPVTVDVWVSAFEIYRGSLFDILNERRKVVACEQADGSVKILGLKEHRGRHFDDVRDIISRGLDRRVTGITAANETSSRSHAILQVSLRNMQNSSHSGTATTASRFTFIDLAGSERGADRADVPKEVRLEGAEINKSLLALKECIRALDQDSQHLPFRQSKLTQVLKDSLVGNSTTASACQTCMIATVSPSATNFEHTLNTLRYADRVKELSSGSGGNVATNFNHANTNSIQKQENHNSNSNNNNINIVSKLRNDVTPKANRSSRSSLSSSSASASASLPPSTPQQPPGNDSVYADIVDKPMESMAVLHDLAEMVQLCNDGDLQDVIYAELLALRQALAKLIQKQ